MGRSRVAVFAADDQRLNAAVSSVAVGVGVLVRAAVSAAMWPVLPVSVVIRIPSIRRGPDSWPVNLAVPISMTEIYTSAGAAAFEAVVSVAVAVTSEAVASKLLFRL